MVPSRYVIPALLPATSYTAPVTGTSVMGSVRGHYTTTIHDYGELESRVQREKHENLPLVIR